MQIYMIFKMLNNKRSKDKLKKVNHKNGMINKFKVFACEIMDKNLTEWKEMASHHSLVKITNDLLRYRHLKVMIINVFSIIFHKL